MQRRKLHGQQASARVGQRRRPVALGPPRIAVLSSYYLRPPKGSLAELAKYLGSDNRKEIVTLINEPHFLVAAECEQSLYACLNYRPSRRKRDEAAKDPMDNIRYYFTSDPEFIGAGGFEGRNFRWRS